MSVNYEHWIANHQPTDPRGKCVEMTALMADAFPELRRVRGHYLCPIEGRRPHWWMVAPDGSIVDPTLEQFPSLGQGDYIEYVGPEPKGQCLNCGELLFDGAAVSGFCNATCAFECCQWMQAGGSISVNGREIWPGEDR